MGQNEVPSTVESPLSFLPSRKIIFWDFDGVIKDSVGAKTAAFEALFQPFGEEVVAKVRRHHEAHGGISRYEKMPLYLEWAGLPGDESQIQLFCQRFAELAWGKVINSPWVDGVREYLLEQCDRQYFVLLTATPQKEIETIVQQLGIAHCFREVHGAPELKAKAMAGVLGRQHIEPNETLMIGDAETDLMAAQANGIPFLLRRTLINNALQISYPGPQFDDLTS